MAFAGNDNRAFTFPPVAKNETFASTNHSYNRSAFQNGIPIVRTL
jgi:hypothetical protein